MKSPSLEFPAGARDVHVWPGGVRLGIVADERGFDDVYATTPKAHKPSALGIGTFKFSKTVWLDLDEDGVDELVIWGDADPIVVALRNHQAVKLQRITWMLAGARDEAAVRARIPALRGYVAPGPGVSPRDVLLSLQLATDEQVRALVDPKGLTICDVHTGNAKPHYRKCKTQRPADMTKQSLFDALFAVRAFADFEGQEFEVRGVTSGSWSVEPPKCEKSKSGTDCSANMGGPGDYEWSFSGSGGSLRLREVSSVIYEST